MNHQERARELVYAWIRDHAPLTVKMNVMPAQSDKLIESVASAILDAKKAAYRRAATVIAKDACMATIPRVRERLEEHARDILALIDKQGG